MTDILIFWLPIVGGILLGGIAVGGWYGGSKQLAVWLAFAGVICFLLVGTLQIQRAIRPQDADEIPPSIALEQRPWLSLEVRLVDALRLDAKGWGAGRRWYTTIEYTIVNTGKTPAINVGTYAQIVPFTISYWQKEAVVNDVPQGPPIPGTDAKNELESICSGSEKLADMRSGLGQIISPGSSATERFTLNGNPARFQGMGNNPGFAGMFLVAVCVTYRSTFGEDRHRTASAFLLAWEHASAKVESTADEEIPVKDMLFTPFPFGGSFVQ